MRPSQVFMTVLLQLYCKCAEINHRLKTGLCRNLYDHLEGEVL